MWVFNATTTTCWGRSTPGPRVVSTARCNEGITIRQVNEYPVSPYNCFEGLEEREPGRCYFSHLGQDVRLVFTLTGEKFILNPLKSTT